MTGKSETGLAAPALLLLAVMSAVGCSSGDDDSGAQAGNGGTTSGGTGGDTATGGATSTGGSSGSGGSSAATGGTTASGGSAGTGGGVPPTPQTCDALQGRVSVDGQVFTIPLARAVNITSSNSNTDRWTFGVNVGDVGFFRLIGSDAIEGQMNQPVDGMPLTIDHGVLAPNVGDKLGTMYAVAAGSGSQLLRQGNQIDVELKGAAVLHNCGDFPVNGQIDLCRRSDGSACPDSAQGGMLDQYNWEDEVTSWSLTNGNLSASVGDQGGNLRARLDASGEGPLKWAVVTTSVFGHYDGKILCAGDGSEAVKMSDATGDYTVIHLKNLAWLEGPGSERASGCLR